MKGLILAGGFATRLRPLSCSKPKLLFPVLGVPLVDRMIGWMKHAGIDEVILAVNHLSERLRLEVGEVRLGARVRLSVEREPLGTGGPIRLAGRLFGSDDFVVVNGDIVSDIDLQAMARTHVDRSATVTMALATVSDPTRFGSVVLGPNQRIASFDEKSPARSSSTLINAGVYIFSKQALDYIPSSGPVSLERTVFPKLVKEGRLWGWKHKGFWYDIGRIPDYVKANMQLLQISSSEDRGTAQRARKFRNSMLIAPSYVGKASRLGPRAIVGPNAVLSERVTVADDATVRNSIVFEDSIIGEGCKVEGALIGERVVIGKRCRIESGAVVAGQVSVHEGSIVRRDEVVLA